MASFIDDSFEGSFEQPLKWYWYSYWKNEKNRLVLKSIKEFFHWVWITSKRINVCIMRKTSIIEIFKRKWNYIGTSESYNIKTNCEIFISKLLRKFNQFENWELPNVCEGKGLISIRKWNYFEIFKVGTKITTKHIDLTFENWDKLTFMGLEGYIF